VTTYPRVDREGNLVPEVADVLRGLREVARLRDMGLSVSPDVDLAMLGHALAEEQAPLAPEELSELLAEVKARNARVLAGSSHELRAD